MLHGHSIKPRSKRLQTTEASRGLYRKNEANLVTCNEVPSASPVINKPDLGIRLVNNSQGNQLQSKITNKPDPQSMSKPQSQRAVQRTE